MWGRVPEERGSAPTACRNPGSLTHSGTDVGRAFFGAGGRKARTVARRSPGLPQAKNPPPVRRGRGILFCCNQSSERIRAERLRASAMTFSSSMRVSTPSR